MEERGGWRHSVTDDLAEFLATRDSLYLASSNAEGQPYIQHRGGPKGFLVPLDDKRLTFAVFLAIANTSVSVTLMITLRHLSF